MSYIDDALDLLASPEHENAIPWMYLDSKGNVTIAIGLLLADSTAAINLPFQDASQQEILNEYKRVKSLKIGFAASYYKLKNSPLLSMNDIKDLTRNKLIDFDSDLRRVFSSYDEFKECLKLALLDMIFNLGLTRFLAYQKMIKAIDGGNFTLAANESHRNGPSDERNEWTKNRILEAGNAS